MTSLKKKKSGVFGRLSSGSEGSDEDNGETSPMGTQVINNWLDLGQAKLQSTQKTNVKSSEAETYNPGDTLNSRLFPQRHGESGE